jgi:DNA transposition AAA+ family ATPase
MTDTAIRSPIALKNVAVFMAMTERLIEREPHLPNIGVFNGPSGYGKSYCGIFASNRAYARMIEVKDYWSRSTFWSALCAELAIPLRKQPRIADMAARAIERLADEPRRPLIIDEADRLVDKGLIEIARDIADSTNIPVILIGEERLPQKLLAFERMHNRVLDWYAAQPADLDDTRQLASAIYPRLKFEDDLLEHVRRESGGRPRRIITNLSRISEASRNRGGKQLTLDVFKELELYTGEPPQPRAIAPFKKARTA